MMNRQNKLQVLKDMGITRWCSRQALPASTSYKVLISIAEMNADNQLDPNKAALLEKMLAALKWEPASYEVVFCPLTETFNHLASQWQVVLPRAVLVFGKDLAQQLGLSVGPLFQKELTSGIVDIAVIERLATVFSDPPAKQAAWKTMQRLMAKAPV